MSVYEFIVFVFIGALFIVYSVKMLNKGDQLEDELDDLKLHVVYIEQRCDELYTKVKDLESCVPRPSKMKPVSVDIIIEKVV